MTHPGPRWCLDPAAMEAVDRAAILAGLPGAALMETAGRAVAETVLARRAAGSAVILVGPGNNGGDGLVAARYLDRAGWHVDLAMFVDPAKLTGDAARQWSLVAPLGLDVRTVDGPAEARRLAAELPAGAVIVDALLGTGLRGEVRQPMRAAIDALSGLSHRVVAVDIPSGVDGASGAIHGAALRAEVTVTFGFPQPGHFVGEGSARRGRLEIVPLGYPRTVLDGTRPTSTWIGCDEIESALGERPRDLHKRAAGAVLVVAGSTTYRGAALLCGGAALRTGAGLCRLAAPRAVTEFAVGRRPELIGEALPATSGGALAAGAAGPAVDLALSADVVVVGPGLMRRAGTERVVRALLETDRPLVLDADALNVLAPDPTPVARAAPTVITPHAGELARWFDVPPAEVERDRIEIAGEAARRWNVHVVLKGAPTVIAGPDATPALNLTGNPGLAVGGSGDVLAGVIGSLVAQGLPIGTAARTAVFVHGLAADWLRADRGERGLLPDDLLTWMPLVLREVECGRLGSLVERTTGDRASLLAVPS